MSRIFWDINLLVYLIEDKGERAEQVAAWFSPTLVNSLVKSEFFVIERAHPSS